jgi:hypothetical protein
VARGVLPAAQVVRHGLEIAAALEEAHGHGVVHGDLKPGNIMVTKFGLKLLDFGLARQLAVASVTDLSRLPTEAGSGTAAGTLPYMAPEVLRGAPCDARGDLWSLGIVLHEIATGVRPFIGQTTFELSAAILSQPPATAPVWVPLGLQTIIRRCLAKGPHDRYQHASEVRAALEAVQSDPSIAPPPPATAHNLPLQLTRFIGREHEIAEVKPLVEAERLVTLTGAGGAGKTRLALQIAQDLVSDYPHGVWVIELAPLADPGLIPHAIASTLGMRPESSDGVTDSLITFLRPRTMLLLLDNCEHVISSCATLVDHVLRVCPRVHVLATSREALGIAGERAWRIPSLVLPAAKPDVSLNAARFVRNRATVRSGSAVRERRRGATDTFISSNTWPSRPNSSCSGRITWRGPVGWPRTTTIFARHSNGRWPDPETSRLPCAWCAPFGASGIGAIILSRDDNGWSAR